MSNLSEAFNREKEDLKDNARKLEKDLWVIIEHGFVTELAKKLKPFKNKNTAYSLKECGLTLDNEEKGLTFLTYTMFQSSKCREKDKDKYYKVIDMLLEAGADPNHTGALVFACGIPDETIVNSLLSDKRIDTNVKDILSDPLTRTLGAAKVSETKGSEERMAICKSVFEALLNKGANPRLCCMMNIQENLMDSAKELKDTWFFKILEKHQTKELTKLRNANKQISGL